MKIKVLLAEDDLDFGNMLKQYLELFEFEVTRVYNGEEAWDILAHHTFDIGVLDVMMPKMDGFSLAQQIKDRYPTLPFIFLTARKLKTDIIQGLKIGADDYIIKPFDADILVLKLKNILSRSKIAQPQIPQNIKIGQYTLTPASLILQSPTQQHRLTEKEMQLLLFLHEHRNRIVKRNDILKAVWSESDFFTGRSMDVFVSRLRKYLKEDINISIKSIRGVGLEFSVKKSI
jgi:DNA-binding response OmpR family regulator